MTDRWIVMMVVVFLGLISLIGMCGTIYLIVHGVDDPVLLLAVSTPSAGALGALTGVLINPHSSPPQPPQPPATDA